MKNLLDIDSTDWFKAKLYFHTNRSQAFMEKGTNGIKQSFIKINGVIYAIAEGKTLGQGGFGIAKVTQTENGENQAIKIEFRAKKDSDDRENKILEKLNIFHGMIECPLGREIEVQLGSNNFKTSHILYRVMELVPGRDLFSVLKDTPLTDVQKLIIAIQATSSLKKIHSFRIIHGDIKPGNMKVKIDGNKISLRILDFGFSYLLPEGEFIARQDKKGTRGYVAQEIMRYGVYSFQSDIFALGKMFQNDLKLTSDIYQEMITAMPYNKPHYDKTLAKLIATLKQKPDLDRVALEFISNVERENLLSVSQGIAEPSSSETSLEEPHRLSQPEIVSTDTRTLALTQPVEQVLAPAEQTTQHRLPPQPQRSNSPRRLPSAPRETREVLVHGIMPVRVDTLRTVIQPPVEQSNGSPRRSPLPFLPSDRTHAMHSPEVIPTMDRTLTRTTQPEEIVTPTTQQTPTRPTELESPTRQIRTLGPSNENNAPHQEHQRTYTPRYATPTFGPAILGELVNTLSLRRNHNINS